MNDSAMSRRQLAVLALTLVAVAVLTVGRLRSQPPPSGPVLVLLDGMRLSVSALEIAGGKISGAAVPAGLTLDDLRQIDLPGPTGAIDKPAVVVEMRGGGRVLGKSAIIGDDKCQVEWGLGAQPGEKLSLPIDVVRAVRFVHATANPEFDKAIAAPAPDADRIFFQVDGKHDNISGLVVSLTDRELTFQFEGQERKLPTAQLYGIVVAQPQAEDEPTRTLISLRDGSQLAGDLTTVAGDKATLELPGRGKVEFPWSAAAKVVVRSNRVAQLSDMKPLAVEESALVTLPRPWQRDKNVMGRPLVLGGRTFDKGIGVHARSALTFAAGRNYDVLAATIGLDAGAGGKGDCLFSVLGDGQPVFTKRVKGNDPPQEIQVEIGRYGEVTLLVEPGAGLDLADHANWCDVRMIKSRK